MKVAGIPFEERVIPLYEPGSREQILRYSPAGKVPVLLDGQNTIWETIGILEYLAERFPKAELWPADTQSRAHARAIAAEMHAGFVELRRAMFMNTRRRFPGKGRTPGALADIGRITALWRDTRARFGGSGPFLFGARFNAADAMYAPVVTRFVTWEPELPADARSYVEAVSGHPLMVEWCRAADAEPWVNPKYETAPD